MAFIGTPVVKLVGDHLVRITGVSLSGTQTPATNVGTIGLFERTVAPDIRLPGGFRPRDYRAADNLVVQEVDCIEVLMNLTTNVGAVYVPIQCVKSGTSPQDFTITLTNNTLGTTSSVLEIYIRHH